MNPLAVILVAGVGLVSSIPVSPVLKVEDAKQYIRQSPGVHVEQIKWCKRLSRSRVRCLASALVEIEVHNLDGSVETVTYPQWFLVDEWARKEKWNPA